MKLLTKVKMDGYNFSPTMKYYFREKSWCDIIQILIISKLLKIKNRHIMHI